MGKGGNAHSSHSSYSKLCSDCCRDDREDRARKGCVPVMVGKDDETMERLDIPTKIVDHPCIVDLLEASADEFGYSRPGLIKIRYDPDSFRQMVKRISKERRSAGSFSFRI